METLAIITLVICILLFAATGVLTLLGIVGRGSEKESILWVNDKYLPRLFNLLLVEVIGIILFSFSAE